MFGEQVGHPAVEGAQDCEVEVVSPPEDVHADVTGTFLVPCYRESAQVARTIRALDELAARLTEVAWSILVVDDGSDDETDRRAVEAARSVRTPVRVVRHRTNAGLGGALRTGFAQSDGDLVVAVDCDLSYGVDDLARIVTHWLATRAHIVLASPYMVGGRTEAVPRALAFRSRAANSFLSRMALEDIKTLTGMVRAYDGPFIRSMSLKAVDADVNVEILYKAQVLRCRIEEVPATLSWRGLEHRTSRAAFTGYRSRWVTYKQLVNGYLWRPFWFPLIPALVAGVLALAILVAGKLDWAAVGVVCSVLTVQLAIASLMSLQAKRYFEELFNAAYGLSRVVGRQPPRVPSQRTHDTVRDARR
jgi:glycosyltransferase involved in cell wall biosynthesis